MTAVHVCHRAINNWTLACLGRGQGDSPALTTHLHVHVLSFLPASSLLRVQCSFRVGCGPALSQVLWHCLCSWGTRITCHWYNAFLEGDNSSFDRHAIPTYILLTRAILFVSCCPSSRRPGSRDGSCPQSLPRTLAQELTWHGWDIQQTLV